MSTGTGQLLQNRAGQLIQMADGRLAQARVPAQPRDPNISSGSCACCCYCDSAGTRGYLPTKLLTISGYNEAIVGKTIVVGSFFTGTSTFTSLPLDDDFCLPLFAQGSGTCLFRKVLSTASVAWNGTNLSGPVSRSSNILWIDLVTYSPPAGGTVLVGLAAYFPEAVPDLESDAYVFGQSAYNGHLIVDLPFQIHGIDITNMGCRDTSDTISPEGFGDPNDTAWEVFEVGAPSLITTFAGGHYTISDTDCS